MGKDKSASAKSRIRVAIVGGGIAGLALATFLSTSSRSTSELDGLDIDIYESAPSLTELGAGVGIWKRTWKILAAAGLAEDLQAVAPEGRDLSDNLQRAFEFRRGDRSPKGLSFYSMEVPFGVLTLHRADFQRALARHAIPPARPHFGKKFVGYEFADENDLSSEIILKFTDGTTAQADLLIGADGIRSTVRHEMLRRLVNRGLLKLGSDIPPSISSATLTDVEYNDPRVDAVSDLIEPVWSGTIVYRSLIPFDALEKRLPGHRAGRGPVVYFGKSRHVLAYPISASTGAITSSNGQRVASEKATSTRMVNLVAFVSDPSREGTRLPPGEPWVRPASRDEVLGKFEGWEEEVSALLELAEKPLAWAIHTVKPLPRYSDADGRVVLLGDAAHAMTPHQGAGGGQAIEDAHLLASLLTHQPATLSTLSNALRAYDAVRVPISQRVVQSSRLNGMMYEFNYGWEEEIETERRLDAEESLVNEELTRLRKLADAIMEIHKWEWEEQTEESQTEKAERLFSEFLGKE